MTGSKNPVAFSGANDELTQIVISSKLPLLPGAESLALYRWENGALSPVSELPGEGGEVIAGHVGSGQISVRHAVSSDGSLIFWAPGEDIAPNLDAPALYLRDTDAEKTSRIDVVQSGVGAGPNLPAFMGASTDGAVVFFTDSQHLTSDANPLGRDLYRCEIGEVEGSLGCTELDDLSAGVSGGESADVKEVPAGISDDGNSLYFVAQGVLDSEPNEFDETARGESPNLYLWRKGAGVRYVATLSEGDRPDWGKPEPVGAVSKSSALSSPSGRYLTFMSELNLAGDESSDPETGEPTEEIFLYDAQAEKLRCVSCNPRGSTDAAHEIIKSGNEGGLVFPDLQGLWAGRFVGATLPETTESESNRGFAFYRPRAVLDNGRVFYNSIAPLVNVDSNGTWDVYQYEPLGVGSCDSSTGSGSAARSGDGCISLISSGTDGNTSVFLDASESGDDLFFLTFAPLSATDTDKIVDVYDAKVGGIEAVVEQHTECQGESCRTSSPAPAAGTPSSAVFDGAGNVNSKPGKHCGKGKKKVKRNGKTKCVKKHHRHRKQGSSARAGK